MMDGDVYYTRPKGGHTRAHAELGPLEMDLSKDLSLFLGNFEYVKCRMNQSRFVQFDS